MKLDTRRTVLIGFGFMSILAFWQFYDQVVPHLLENVFGLRTFTTNAIMSIDNVSSLILLPLFGTLSDKTKTRLGRRTPYILFGTLVAVCLMGVLAAATASRSFPLFFTALLCLLVTMSTYRSPAVAYMPDVTPKPLRSKANAIINLMGAIGGALVLLLTNFLLVKTVNAAGETVSDYTYLFMTVAFLLMAAMLIIRGVIPERKLAAETDEINRRLDAEKPTEPAATPVRKLHKAEMTSLMLILASVALWFMGYNAVTTAFSKYAMQVLNVAETAAANCVLVATVVAIISYWPVGILSSKLGRKKMIMGGIALLMVAFLAAGLLRELTFLAYVCFALVGMGWASIGVNSYPMVVELAAGGDVGKYTGYYYTFSMAAQVLTPILSGALLEHVGYWTLFPYAFVMLTLAMLTMSRVKHGDSKPEAKKGLEALDVDD